MSVGLYRVVSLVQAIGSGAAGSWLISVSAVAKPNSPNVPYCIPNELICSEIGRFLRLPLPPAAIVYAPDIQPQFWFASFDFNLTGNSLPPVNPQRCATELSDPSTGLVLFDVLIANPDRHPANFSVDFGVTPPQMNVFDHSHALFGAAAGNGQVQLSTNRAQLGIGGHCLLNALATDQWFAKWIERIQAIPDFLIEEVTQTATGYGINASEATEAKDFLKSRRDSIKGIIEQNKSLFTGISQWSLF
jgi:hypothetical protein